MKKYVLFLLYLYGMILILPLLLSILITGGVLGRYLSGEDRCLPLLLAAQTPEDYPSEALRAQAVLVRTNREAAGNLEDQVREFLNICESPDAVRGVLERYERCREALETTDEVLTYEGKVCRVPWHRVNNGRTRDGAETFRDDSHGYLVSVDSAWDCSCPDYAKTGYYSGDYAKNLEIISRDSAGYVAEVRAGAEIISGEELRAQMELPSGAFSFQRADGGLRILTRGVGHGLGLSQWGARSMALEGSSYIEILYYYFPRMEIN